MRRHDVSAYRRVGVSALMWIPRSKFVICNLSFVIGGVRQATPVAGGDVFRRLTRTLTFMD